MVSVKISNGVISIGEYAFSNNSLKSIEIPESVTIIKSSAFFNNGLKKVTFSNGLTTIESSAFSWNKLTSVVIPNSVVTVENNAFVYNELKTVQIGTSIESRIMENTGIGKNAFSKSSSSNENLTKIINKSGKALAFENALFGNDSTSYISSGTITNNTYGNVEVTLE